MNNSFTRRAKCRGIAVGWVVAWILVWIANCSLYGFRQHTGLPLYMEASQHLVEGSKLYRVTGVETEYDRYAYPPAMTLANVPLLPFNETVQRILWAGFNSGLLVFSIALVNTLVRNKVERRARDEGKPPTGIYALFWVIVGAVMIRHVLSPLENQSQDIMILFLLAAGTWALAGRRGILAGSAFGIASAIKLTPLIFIVLLVMQGRIKAGIAMIAAFILVSIAPDVLIPRSEGGPRIVAYYEFVGEAAAPGQSGGAHWSKWYQLNQNLAGTLYRISMPAPESMAGTYPSYPLVPMGDGFRTAITYLLQLVIILMVLAAGWMTRGSPRDEGMRNLSSLAACGTAACAMLLLSPQSSKSHFVVLLIPAAAVTLHYILNPRDMFALVMLVIAFIAGTLTAKGLLGKDLGEEVLAAGPVALTAAVLGLGSFWVSSRSKEVEETS